MRKKNLNESLLQIVNDLDISTAIDSVIKVAQQCLRAERVVLWTVDNLSQRLTSSLLDEHGRLVVKKGVCNTGSC